jgi:hypothetical protein
MAAGATLKSEARPAPSTTPPSPTKVAESAFERLQKVAACD